MSVNPDILDLEDNDLIKNFEKAARDGKSAECSAIKNNIENIANNVEKRVSTGLIFFENIGKENKLFNMLDKAAYKKLQNISKSCTQPEKIIEFYENWSFVDKGGKKRLINKVEFDFRYIAPSGSLLPRISFQLNDGREYVLLEQESEMASSCMQCVERSLKQGINFLNSDDHNSEMS